MINFSVGGWSLTKAAEDEKTVQIRLIANKLEVDREKQKIVPVAFNKATVSNFLSNGILDWHHQSVLGKTPEDRAKAILGRPESFSWESNLPVVYGRLTKAHPIVRESILPHLEAGQPVFGASVGGSILKAETVVDPVTKRQHEIIKAIDWNHLAIAAAPYVMSPGTQVTMVKADTGNQVMVRFSNLDDFEENHGTILYDLSKAIMIGSGSDSAALVGGDALRGQSLEGDYGRLVEEVSFGLLEGSIGPTKQGVIVYLKSRGMDQSEASDFLNRLIPAIQKITGG